MSTIDPQEIARFSKQAKHWWDVKGPLKGLHQMNPTRLSFIREHILSHLSLSPDISHPLKDLRLCDVGCGGGLLTEPLARLGGKITGIDASNAAIQAAKEHADQVGLNIDYRCTTTSDLIQTAETFDMVLSLEVLEHVSDPSLHIQECCKLLKPGGLLFLSTINQTRKSWLFGILIAENILKWAPKGAHDWHKFIKPAQLSQWMRQHGCAPTAVEGMQYRPLGGWSLGSDTNINYIACGVRA